MAERGETTALCICKSQGVASLQSLVGPANLNKVPDGLYAVRRIGLVVVFHRIALFLFAFFIIRTKMPIERSANKCCCTT